MIQFQEKVNELRINLNEEQQKMLSLNSIHNFLIFYDKLTEYKTEVEQLLFGYFQKIEEENYIVDKKTSTEIAFDYVMKIGSYYTLNLGFKVQMKLSFALFWGIHADAVLLIIGLLSKVYYIPIVTLLLLSRWWYLKVFYEKKNRVHNVRY